MHIIDRSVSSQQDIDLLIPIVTGSQITLKLIWDSHLDHAFSSRLREVSCNAKQVVKHLQCFVLLLGSVKYLIFALLSQHLLLLSLGHVHAVAGFGGHLFLCEELRDLA
jgi:ABC-type siderophore export system fused ATPase/permease subunit